MMNIEKWHKYTLGEKVVEALKKNWFNAVYLENKEEAVKYILENIKEGDKVGFGGSATIKELGIAEEAKKLGAIVLDHGMPNLTAEEKMEIRRAQLTSDLFLCSSNAITLNGELVNVDGAGNRVAAMTFGPKKVIVAVGINKICIDEKAALERIKMIAAPMNSKRLGLSTPCAQTGVCMDCKNESRICRSYNVLKKKPMATDLTVLVIGENIGY
ncbi:lactate utilization protein [Clostridium homopropionicum]|uniref:lactate utilization protein n=1 Tax=Clostridium homopropionicum TaxID=36844 RepID=UPI0009E2C950|nr:lactate utilization protein [Clostridium homopropionicum]